jgi:hypothetical protein
MNPVNHEILSSCQTNCGSKAISPVSLALRRHKALFFPGITRLSLPFESFKNREHPLVPDCIKVGSVCPNPCWSPL